MLITDSNKLDISRINKNVYVQVLSLANSFIVAFTFACSEFFDNYVLKLLVCFVVLIVMIFIIYKFIGFVYKRKEGK